MTMFVASFLQRIAMRAASAQAVAPSYNDALATSIPVSAQMAD